MLVPDVRIMAIMAATSLTLLLANPDDVPIILRAVMSRF